MISLFPFNPLPHPLENSEISLLYFHSCYIGSLSLTIFVIQFLYAFNVSFSLPELHCILSFPSFLNLFFLYFKGKFTLNYYCIIYGFIKHFTVFKDSKILYLKVRFDIYSILFIFFVSLILSNVKILKWLNVLGNLAFLI